METDVTLPDGRQVTLQHEGELSDEAIKNAVGQLGYDLPMGKDEIMRNIAAEGTRLLGGIGGAVKGSQYGLIGAAAGGILGAGGAELLARQMVPTSTGTSLANIALAGVLPEAKGATLLGRLGRGALEGAGFGMAHDVIRNAVDTQTLPGAAELGENALGGALVGGALHGVIGARPEVPAEAPPVVPPPAPAPTKEGAISAALDGRKATSLAESNANANEIATGAPAAPPAAPAVAAPTGVPVEGGGMQIVNQGLAHNGEQLAADFELPKELAGAKPRYAAGSNQFGLEFDSDLDKALYILAQNKPSARDADYLQAVIDHTGATEQEIRAAGRNVKAQIKALAKDSDEDVIQVPEIGMPEKVPVVAAAAQVNNRKSGTKLKTDTPTGFTTSAGSTYELNDSGSTIRTKSNQGLGDEGIKEPSQQTVYVDKEDGGWLWDMYGDLAKKGVPVRIAIQNDKAILEKANGMGEWNRVGKVSAAADTQPKVGLSPLELFDDGAHLGHPITEIHYGEQAEVEPNLPAAMTPKGVDLEDTDAIEKAAAAQQLATPPKESIASAAVKFSDGEIRTGTNHAEIVDGIGDKDLRGSDDGFVTSTGRYVSREEAMKIAKDSGQVEKSVRRKGLAIEMMNEKPLPPETILTHQKLGDKSFTQVDVPNPAGGRPVFSGSLGDALKAGYKFNLPSAIPEGRTTFAELTARREAELNATKPLFTEHLGNVGEPLEKPAAALPEPVKAPLPVVEPQNPVLPERPVNAPETAKAPPPPITPVATPENTGSSSDLPIRKGVRAALADRTKSDEYKKVLADNPDIQYVRARHGEWEDAADSSTDTELRQLIGDAKSNDEKAIYLRKLSNRLLAKGQNDEAQQLFVESTKLGTPAAQTLRAMGAVRTAFGDLAEVESVVNKAGRNLSEAQKNKVLDMSSKVIETKGIVNNLEREAKENFTPKTLAEFREASVNYAKAQKEFEEYSTAIAPRSFPDMLTKMVQGNLLTPLSLVSTALDNFLWVPVDRTAKSIASIMDAMVSTGIRKLGGESEATGRSMFSSNPLPSRMELGAIADGVRVSAKELLTGPSTDSYIKEEVHRGFRPLRSLMDAWSGENLPLNDKGNVAAWDRAKALIEGTFGIPPETMFRLISVADKPFRNAAAIRTYLEQAKLKGIKDEDLQRFITFPDATTKAMAKAASRRSIFADENAGITTLNHFLDSDIAKLLRVDKIPVLAGALKVFGRMTVPFRQFPINYALSALNFAAPQLGMAKALFYGVKSHAAMSAKGLTPHAVAQIVLDNRRKALTNFGEAVLGMTMYAAASTLWANGLISESPANTAIKRSTQSEAMGAAKINQTGIERYLQGGDPAYQKGDTLHDWTRGGIPSVVFHIFTQQAASQRDKDAKIGQNQNVTADSFMQRQVDNAVHAIPGLGSFIFDQSFLSGTSSLIEALKDADPDSPVFQNWMNNMFKAVSSIALPNTLDTIARARMEYQPELRGSSEIETLGNIWKHKSLQLPDDEQGLVLKRDTWGRPIPTTPPGANPYAYALADITKTSHQIADEHDQKLFDLYSETNRPSVYPDPIKPVVNFRGNDYKLDPHDAETLQEDVGTLRRQRMEQFVDSEIWTSLKPDERVLGLERIYQGANTDGLREFVNSPGMYQRYFSSNPDRNTAVSKTTQNLLKEQMLKGQ